jgi:hypothetical protein
MFFFPIYYFSPILHPQPPPPILNSLPCPFYTSPLTYLSMASSNSKQKPSTYSCLSSLSLWLNVACVCTNYGDDRRTERGSRRKGRYSIHPLNMQIYAAQKRWARKGLDVSLLSRGWGEDEGWEERDLAILVRTTSVWSHDKVCSRVECLSIPEGIRKQNCVNQTCVKHLYPSRTKALTMTSAHCHQEKFVSHAKRVYSSISHRAINLKSPS